MPTAMLEYKPVGVLAQSRAHRWRICFQLKQDCGDRSGGKRKVDIDKKETGMGAPVGGPGTPVPPQNWPRIQLHLETFNSVNGLVVRVWPTHSSLGRRYDLRVTLRPPKVGVFLKIILPVGSIKCRQATVPCLWCGHRDSFIVLISRRGLCKPYMGPRNPNKTLQDGGVCMEPIVPSAGFSLRELQDMRQPHAI